MISRGIAAPLAAAAMSSLTAAAAGPFADDFSADTLARIHAGRVVARERAPARQRRHQHDPPSTPRAPIIGRG